MDAAIELIGNTPRAPYEPAFPEWGTLLIFVNDQSHPLKHLRQVIRKLAVNFGEQVTETMLENFQQIVGHRTDADIDIAAKSILRNENMTKMPTTGKFLAECGVLRVYRDGRKA